MEPAAATEPKPGDLLDAKIREAIRLKRRMARAKDIAAARSSKLQALVCREIPNLFTEVGGAENKKVDGITCAMGTKVAGSLGKAADEEAAVKHLRDLGFTGAIATVLLIEFTEEERALVAALADVLAQLLSKDVTFERSVHHSTLAAFAAERLREGKPVDLECLGLSAWREAKLTGKGLN